MNFNAEIEIDLKKLKENVRILKTTYDDYTYVFANVKNNCFGMGYGIIDTLVKGGVNYLLVSTLSEALEIRKMNAFVKILVNSEVATDFIYDAIMSNITITIQSLENLEAINELELKDTLNVHLLIDNGSNKLGLKSKEEVRRAVEIISQNERLSLEGVYTDLTTYGVLDEDYYHEFNQFLRCIEDIQDKENLILHLNEPIMYHKKNETINGIRFDLSLLGIEENIDDGIVSNMKIKKVEKKYDDLSFPDIDLTLIFTIKARIIGLNTALKKTLIGRNYYAPSDMRLGIIPIGHKDGITKAIRSVLINGVSCPVVGDEIDYLIIGVLKDTKLGDTVYILNEEMDVYNLIGSLKTNRFYLMSILNNTLMRNYINLEEEDNLL